MTGSARLPGFVVGGTASGVGKTVATLAIVRALEGDGYAVQPAKAGPDFIDPSHHTAVAGRPSRTLDPWLCGTEGLRRNYARGRGDGSGPSARGRSSPEVCVVEGMMGLYDGDIASTAAVADQLGLPVVLVVDANAGMESVAATALGFREYATEAGRDIEVAGIVAGRAHGGRHEDGIREALPDAFAYFGRIPPMDGLEIPDRHLGLQMGEEAPIDDAVLKEAGEHLETDRLRALAREPPAPGSWPRADDPVGARVAVADDAAFRFRYPATVERLRERAEVIPFSPVADDPVPDCEGVYLPGGYPELHAPELASSGTLDELADRASEGLPVLGECGGMMAMADSLTTADGDRYGMAGILPADVRMHDGYRALDHVKFEARERTLTADRGESIRGHEFHYSSAEAAPDARFAFAVRRGEGIDGDHDGLVEYDSLGTYAHVHPESGAFDRFLERLPARPDN